MTVTRAGLNQMEQSGQQEKENPSVRLVVQLPDVLLRKLEAEAGQREIPAAQLAVNLLEGWFKSHSPR